MSEQGTLTADLDRADAKIAETLSVLPADVRIKTAERIKVDGADGLATLNGRSCGHCSKSLTPNRISQLNMGKPVICESCGSLVYLAESSDD